MLLLDGILQMAPYLTFLISCTTFCCIDGHNSFKWASFDGHLIAEIYCSSSQVIWQTLGDVSVGCCFAMGLLGYWYLHICR